MRPFLEKRGIEVVETDLGERIQQLDDEPPSHVVVPAVHKLRGDVAEVFGRTIGTDAQNHDVGYLAESQRRHTRPYYLKAQAGMTGANFAVAETGTFVVCTNEGNADLSANVPPLHIAAAAGLEFLPRFMIYNPFNAWGKQRELPATPPLTFRQWYVKNRKAPR
jgi:L-lactate dehydrogenase complex protein LldF